MVQQATEKSVKALYQKSSGEARRHSVRDLLKSFAEKVDVLKEAFESVKGLGQLHIK